MSGNPELLYIDELPLKAGFEIDKAVVRSIGEEEDELLNPENPSVHRSPPIATTIPPTK